MLEKLETYFNNGLLTKQTHPYFDLTIWNYTPKVQYERLWDSTTKICRGLVTNSVGERVAIPFPKFFNIEEIPNEQIPNQSFEVFEKMDGSLGILFHYNGEWVMASRGSFTSEQSLRAKKILDTKYLEFYEHADINHTYLFEIIYPENRIVVDYNGEEKLVLLSIVHTPNAVEVNFNYVQYFGNKTNIEVVKKYDSIEDYTILKDIISNDSEGFVIRFRDGFRMKIKGEEYIRLHRIITNVSTRDVWEYLKENKPFDELLDKVPDEFYTWVKDTKESLENQFNEIKLKVEKEFRTLINKKEYAEKIKDNPIKHLLFKRLDSYSQEMDKIIWDMVYPEYSKPFKTKTDD